MKRYFFDNDWKNWIWSNIKNGVSKQRIYEDLVKKNFDVFTIMNELRFIPNTFRKGDGISCNRVIGYLQAANAIKIEAPIPLFTLPNFLSEAECQEIIAIQKTNCTQSTTDLSSKPPLNEIRNGSITLFETIQSDSIHMSVQFLKQKIVALMGIPIQYAEPIQGQWYQQNGFYDAHFDAYHDYNDFHAQSGNRTWTCMITLNTVKEGGDTYFPKLNQRFKARSGQALVWYNLNHDGLVNPLTLHTEESIIKGEKFVVMQWFTQVSARAE